MRDIVFISRLCPGDIVVISAAIRELLLAHPHQFGIAVDTPTPEIWDNNETITHPRHFLKEPERINIDLPFLPPNPSVHYVQHYADYLAQLLMVKPFTVKSLKGELNLSREEVAAPSLVDQPYWVVNAGIKGDAQTKRWPHRYYQSVVDHFRDRIQFVQVGKLGFQDHHEPLHGAINLLGKTTVRQLIKLVSEASGVLTPISFCAHIAGAFEIPSVIISGGKENPCFTQYPNATIFSSIGKYDCCRSAPCGKEYVEAIPGTDAMWRCRLPVGHTAQCMIDILPQQVVEAIGG